MKSLYRTLLTFALLLGVSFLLPGCSPDSHRHTVTYVPVNYGHPIYNGYPYRPQGPVYRRVQTNQGYRFTPSYRAPTVTYRPPVTFRTPTFTSAHG